MKVKLTVTESRCRDCTCQKGDVLDAALVTDSILCNCTYEEKSDDNGTKSYNVISREKVIHKICFIEMNSAGVDIGKYSYETPYMMANTDNDSWYGSIFPATATCRHVVHNSEATSVRMVIDFAVPIKNGPDDMNHQTVSRIYALLVEKNK